MSVVQLVLAIVLCTEISHLAQYHKSSSLTKLLDSDRLPKSDASCSQSIHFPRGKIWMNKNKDGQIKSALKKEYGASKYCRCWWTFMSMSFASWLKLTCTLCSLHIHTPLERIRDLKGAWLKCSYLVWIECVCMLLIFRSKSLSGWRLLSCSSQLHNITTEFFCRLRTSPHLISILGSPSHGLLTQESSNCTSLALVQSNKLLMQCDA